MDLFSTPPGPGGDVVKGFGTAVLLIMAAVVVVGGILLLRVLVRAFSPRVLCGGCKRYFPAGKAVCPFCGAAREDDGDETAATE